MQTHAANGAIWRISAGDYSADISELGATLVRLQHDGHDLVAGFDPDAMRPAARGQLLAPWPNRIEDGRYCVDGQEYQLPLSEPERANASHGLLAWQPWRLVEQTSARVTAQATLYPQPGWAWPLTVQVTYSLSEAGLTVEVSATNHAASTCPFGFGAHPYLTAGEPSLDQASLTLAVRTALDTDERLIPRGRHDVAPFAARSLAGLNLDTCFTDVSGVRADQVLGQLELMKTLGSQRVWEAALTCAGRSTVLWASEQFRFVQLFTGDGLPAPDTRRGLAVEPMTCAPNAFNSGEGLLWLAPGETWTGTFGILQRPA